MRAVLCNEFGEPETLSVGDALEFEPGEGEVQIAIAAAGVNFADILMVAGKYQEKPEFPFSPGLELPTIPDVDRVVDSVRSLRG